MSTTHELGPQLETPNPRMPVVFVPHGGGPWPFVDLGIEPAEVEGLTTYLRSVAELPKIRPSALLVISAHWEEAVPTVMTAERPPMLYDYYGFPSAAYELTWPAPGAPDLAARVQSLLSQAGIGSAADARRGFDHGTFVPLKLTYPEASLPSTQLSLKCGLDPSEHMAIGRALAPLREQGVFIIGSGMTYHNLRTFFDPRANVDAEVFDAWLTKVMLLPARERERALAQWVQAPAARLAHPREEHLIPLMVISGLAHDEVASVGYSGTMMGKRLSAYHFG